mgnify:CR=1 FL=1
MIFNFEKAEEFLLSQDCIRNVEDFFNDVQPIDLIEFAKLHVQKALEEASEKASAYIEQRFPIILNKAVVDKDSILHAYPLRNIK